MRLTNVISLIAVISTASSIPPGKKRRDFGPYSFLDPRNQLCLYMNHASNGSISRGRNTGPHFSRRRFKVNAQRVYPE